MGFTDDLDTSVTDLETQATATEGVEASAVLIINSFAAAVIAVANDATKVKAVAARYKASADLLAAAAAANPLPVVPPVA
jgi:hypothetical protein